LTLRVFDLISPLTGFFRGLPVKSCVMNKFKSGALAVRFIERD